MLAHIDEFCKPQICEGFESFIYLFARDSCTIQEGQTVIVPLGIKIDLSTLWDKFSVEEMETFKRSFYFELHSRKALNTKGVISSVEIIDIDYKEELFVILHSIHSNFMIRKGDRIAKLVLKEHQTSLLKTLIKLNQK